MVISRKLSIDTRGICDAKDLTSQVAEAVAESGLTQGIVTVFVPGSTAGLTTLEYEAGAVRDLQEAVERLFPCGISYRHDQRWGDGNGFSHIRAAMLGPSLTVPFQDQRLMLGSWQQVVLVDFDNRPRKRTVVLQIIGEE